MPKTAWAFQMKNYPCGMLVKTKLLPIGDNECFIYFMMIGCNVQIVTSNCNFEIKGFVITSNYTAGHININNR